MARHQSGDKPLSESVITQFANAYVHLTASMSQGFEITTWDLMGSTKAQY